MSHFMMYRVYTSEWLLHTVTSQRLHFAAMTTEFRTSSSEDGHWNLKSSSSSLHSWDTCIEQCEGGQKYKLGHSNEPTRRAIVMGLQPMHMCQQRAQNVTYGWQYFTDIPGILVSKKIIQLDQWVFGCLTTDVSVCLIINAQRPPVRITTVASKHDYPAVKVRSSHLRTRTRFSSSFGLSAPARRASPKNGINIW